MISRVLSSLRVRPKEMVRMFSISCPMSKTLSRKNMVTYDPPDLSLHQNLLDRVSVVEEVGHSRAVVDKIMEIGGPVAVDMEGVEQGTTSMVQVCDTQRNISLFRTGFNPGLYREGGLARLLESPFILKIMHAATIDCLSAYKDGVKLWNLYDTSVAHRVLEYQINGRSMYSSPQIGFNNLCNYCGVPENPMKDRFKDIFFKMIITRNGTRGLDTVKVLQDDVILYCAMDVEPLHEIHSLLSSLVAPDYSHLVKQLSEIEIIRAIDPDLAKKKRKNLQSIETCNIFLSNLPSSTQKPDVYSAISTLEGHKHVYFSDVHNSANIILDLRAIALKASKSIGEALGGEARLVVPGEPTETVVSEEADPQQGDRTDSWVTDPAVSRKLVDKLIKTKCPVVLDFHQYPECSAMEIYWGRGPSVKVVITDQMVEEGGLGLLVSSPSLVKVVFRLDVSSVQQTFKLFSKLKVEVVNVFEIDGAVKGLDYAEHGLSIFKAESRNIQKVCSALGLVYNSTSKTKLDWYYLTYLHLARRLPSWLTKVLEERTEILVAIGAYQESVVFKEKRRQLRKRLEQHCVHLRVVGGKGVGVKDRERLKSLVMTTLLARDIRLVDYLDLGHCALVYLPTKDAVNNVLKELETQQEVSGMRFRVTSPHLTPEVVERPKPVPVDMGVLETVRQEHLARIKTVRGL